MKKILSIILSAMMVLSTITVAFAEETKTPAGYLTMSIEASTLGLGFIEEPTKVPFYEGESVAQVFARFLSENSRDFDNTGTIENGFYLSNIQTDYASDIEMEKAIVIPQYILDMYNKTQQDYFDMGANDNGSLGEMCYSFMSGWMIYSANVKALTSAGVSNVKAVDGDTIRWQFSVDGLGKDLCYSSDWNNSGDLPFVQADKDALFAILGAVNVNADAKAKLQALNNYNDIIKKATTVDLSQAEVNSLVDTIYNATGVSYEYIATKGTAKTVVPTKDDTSEPSVPTTPTVNQTAIDQIATSLDYIYSQVTAPTLGTNGGEWAIIALGRGGYAVSDTYYSDYVARLGQIMIDSNGVLHKYKKSENARVIMALSAIGKTPFDIGGYGVRADISNYDDTIYQGVNGAVYALIAMDTNNYEFVTIAETDKQNSRKRLLEYIFSQEISGGGFALSGSTADTDITAMTLQALTSYVNGNDMLKAEFGSDEAGYNAMIAKVKEVIERAITALSGLQQADGDFTSWGSLNCESGAQVIVALTGLGIDPMTDARFITSTGKTPIDGLLKYLDSTGGFKHVISGSVNQMATEQATYALVAYERFVNGKNRLYDMTEAFESGTTTPPTTDPVPNVKTVNVNLSFEQDNYYVILPQTVEVSSDLSDKYGYKDQVTDGVSVLDTVIKAHEIMFGDAFTKADKDTYLAISDSGWVTTAMCCDGKDFGYAVNGLMPNDGVKNSYGTYTGYMMNQAKISENDTVQYFFYNPAGYYGEIYSNFSKNGTDVTELTAGVGSDIKLSVEGYSYMYEGCNETIVWKPVKNAQISLVSMEGDTAGALVDLDKIVTDDKGEFTVKFNEIGTYYLAVNSDPDNFTYVIPQILKVTVKDNLTITTPEQIIGEADTEFNAVVTANTWTDSTVKMIDGIYNIPEYLEVVDVVMGSSVTGGELQYNLVDGKLRFAYMSETMGDITLSTETLPVELMTIKLKLKDTATEEISLEISAESISFKTDSQTSENIPVTNTKDDVIVTAPIPDPVASARIIYTGDDTDLIDSTKQAVAVEILNLQETSKVMFGETEIMYSAEMTAKKGVNTYVAITSTEVTVEQLNDMANYTITAETPANITFADVNEDEVVNAQDSLDTLSFWLRKTAIESDKQILTANVNADSSITTFDVLAIMELVVNDRELDIISK